MISCYDDLTVLLDEHAPEHGAAEPAEAVVDSLEEALHAGPQLRVRVVRDEAAARRPHSRVGDAWNIFQ